MRTMINFFHNGGVDPNPRVEKDAGISAVHQNVRPPEVMTGVTDRAAAPDRKIIYIVNTHGWHVMKIIPKSQDPGSAFTIGLSRMFETVALS